MIFREFPGENLFGLEAVNIIRKGLIKDTIGGKKERKTTVVPATLIDEEYADSPKNKFFPLAPGIISDSIAPAESRANRLNVMWRIYRKNKSGNDPAIRLK